MNGRVIIKTGFYQAVKSAIDGMSVLWLKDLGHGQIAAAVTLPETQSR